MLQIRKFEFNPFQENTYVLSDDTKACVVIDPGCCDKPEQDELVDYIESNGLSVKLLLNTHCHIDHVLGNWFVKERFHVPFLIHRIEEIVLKAQKVLAPNYGFHQYQEAAPDDYLEEGKPVRFGQEELDVIFVPGHAPGHVAFYHSASKTLVGGDVLFYNSVGRIDLPGGNYLTLMESIQKKLFKLPDDTVVYPGHGPETSIGFEKKTNPFCALT